MKIFETLGETGLPVAYRAFETKQKLPYIVYIGDGQGTFGADDTVYYAGNKYQVEYYFDRKNEANEAKIEKTLTDNGFFYEKSEDAYIESEGVSVIYYYVN